MVLAIREKNEMIGQLVDLLRNEKEITRIVVFGSFLASEAPHDMDVAVYQTSQESYLPLAVKYRRLTRPLAARVPLDIFPLRPNASDSVLLPDIERGTTVYEK